MNSAGVRKKSPRLLVVLVAATVVLSSVYVFLTAGREEKRLRILVKQGVESVALKEIAQEFSKERHVTVELVQLPYNEVYEKEKQQLDVALNSDAVPRFDIFMVDDPWLYAFARGGRLKNVNNLLKGREADFFPSTLSVASYCPSRDDCSEYYAVPFVANSQIFVFRAADFQKSLRPTTWQQVLDASEKIEKAQEGRIGYVTRIGPGNSIVTDFMPILWAYDPLSFPKFLRDGNALKNPEESFTALKNLVSTREKLGSASFDDFDVSAYLQKQRATMGIAWSAWAMILVDIEYSQTHAGLRPASAASNLPDCTAEGAVRDVDSNEKPNEDLIFDDIPRSSKVEMVQSSPDSRPGPELGVWLLAVPYNAPQQNLALDFISYSTDLGDDPCSKRHQRSLLAARSGTPPPRMSVLEELAHDQKYKRHPSLIPAISRSLRAGRPRPRTACWTEIESRLGAYLETLIEQCVKPKDITECANQDVTRLFNSDNCEAFPNPAEITCLEQTITASRCKIP